MKKTSSEESDAYFDTRPEGSRIGAWASPQSKVIENRKILEEKVELFNAEYNGDVPRPSHWGGYRVMPAVIEFWQGRPSRLHDRIRYTKQSTGKWKIERLAP